MNELKVKDRVIATYAHDDNNDIINKIGTIIATRPCSDGTQYLTIEFDEPIRRGHRDMIPWARMVIVGICHNTR